MSKSDGHTTDTKLPSPNGLNGVTLSPLSADSNVQSMAVRYPVSRDDEVCRWDAHPMRSRVALLYS